MGPETEALKASEPPVHGKETHWFRGTVPPHLLQTAHNRLGLLAAVGGLTLLGGFLFFFETEESFIEGFDSRIISISAVVISCILSLAVVIATRFKRISAVTVIKLGFVWEILFGLSLAIAQRMESCEAYMEFRGFSAVSVLLITYAVIVPSGNMFWMLLSAVLTALMDPLGLMINVALGKPMPPADVLVSMFVPTGLAVFIAVFCAGLVFRLRLAIHQARQLGSYRLVEPLGKGGSGEIWRAEHHMLARPAAIKLIKPEAFATSSAQDTEQVLRQFKQEAQATALLDSEHSIHLYDYGATEDGSLYYVMELLQGLDLEALVVEHGPVCPERVLLFLSQICDSLAEAHSRGLIHCDIKPANLFLCRRGLAQDFIKVLDFGLVKKAARKPASEKHKFSSVRGTPAYLAPEIILGDSEPDARSDIYALGCVAYWLLSGHMVFERAFTEGILQDHVESMPMRLKQRASNPIPEKLEDIVHNCLEKKPGKRPQSITDLAASLMEVQVDSAWTPDRARAWWERLDIEFRSI